MAPTNKTKYGNDLIPGLPDELAMDCLLRLPITSHTIFRLVSHQWNSTFSHPCFFTLRRRANFADNHIFLIQPQTPQFKFQHPQDENNHQHHPLLYNLSIYNTSNHEWRCLAGLTIPAFSQCVVLPQIRQLVVLGGWDPTTLEPVSRVLVLDLARGIWREGSPMPTARSFFASASASASSTVYVAGGHDGQKNALKSAEAYDVVRDEWKELPSMAEERDESYGLKLKEDGKFWVVSGYGTETQGRFRSDAEVFDPDKWGWETVPGLWPNPGKNPKSTAVVTVEGERRWWDVVEGEIREFEWEEKVWKGVNMGGSIPKRVNGSSRSICLIDVGNGKIMMMGNGESSGGGEGMFILEREKEDKMKMKKMIVVNKNNCGGGVNWRCQHVEVPSRFMGFPFSTTHILM